MQQPLDNGNVHMRLDSSILLLQFFIVILQHTPTASAATPREHPIRCLELGARLSLDEALLRLVEVDDVPDGVKVL